MAIGFEVRKRWSTDQLIHGIELQDFLQLLKKNQWRVDPVYLHRLAMVAGLAVPATLLGRIEDMRYGRALSTLEIDPEPLFAIGHWRSGTTHLHNLLGRLPDFTYPTVLQVIFPTCFLSADSFLPQLTGRLLDGTRTYDNVKQGWHEAAEDEIALAKLTGMSPYLAFMFPEQAAKYERYVDFLECSQAEKDRWKDAFRYLVKKIMLQTASGAPGSQPGRKRVVVKSCTHTARIRMILEMFPNAKFVHIHRHPYEVFASTLHMRSHTDWENFFHLPDADPEILRKSQTLELGRRIYDRVIEDRALVPAENWFELGYTDLVGHEVDVIGRMYEQFGYEGWERARPVLEGYLDGVKGYQRNQLKLDARSRDEVYEAWKPAFEAWGYPKDYDTNA